jgi:carboxymethylenebutenolidase
LHLVNRRVDSASWNETYPKGRVVRPGDFDIYSVGKSSHGLAIIVIYDIRGFNISQTRVFCDRLASEYSVQVVMPDFFRGTASPTNGNRTTWLAGVGSWSKVSNELIYVANWLRHSSSTKKIGLVGFCWGGLQVVRACSNLSNLFFTGISIHGSSITVAEVQQLKKPMLFIAASNDPALKPNISDAIEQSNPAISKQCEYKTYPNVKHGFAAAGANYSNPVNVAAIDDVHLTVRNYLNKIINNNSIKLSINFACLLILVCFSFHFYI